MTQFQQLYQFHLFNINRLMKCKSINSIKQFCMDQQITQFEYDQEELTNLNLFGDSFFNNQYQFQYIQQEVPEIDISLEQEAYYFSSEFQQNPIKGNHSSQISSDQNCLKQINSKLSQKTQTIQQKQLHLNDLTFDQNIKIENVKTNINKSQDGQESTCVTKSNISTRKRRKSRKSSSNSNYSSKKKINPKKQKVINTEMLARVEHLFKQNNSVQIVKNQLNISHKTVLKLYSQFKLNGRLSSSQNSLNNSKITQQKQKQYELVQQILKKLITQNCSITLRHMQNALKQRGIYRSKSTIHAYLQKMRYSRKKLQKIPLERNSSDKLKYRQNYCKMIQQIPLQKQVFLDQTIFGLQTSGHYGWAPKGEQPKVYYSANRRQHITLLAAISINGFEATNIIKGPVTSRHICQFLQHYLDHLQPDEVLILDNARMHHAAIVKEKIRSLNRSVRYLPAYTPQLNPIQNVFSEIKANYIRLKEDKDLKRQEMIKLVEVAVKNMRSKEFSRYYKHYEQWLKLGAAGQLFN